MGPNKPASASQPINQLYRLNSQPKKLPEHHKTKEKGKRVINNICQLSEIIIFPLYLYEFFIIYDHFQAIKSGLNP